MQYIAKKDNTMFYVSPEMIEHYASQGYAIARLVEEAVPDASAEAALAIGSMTVGHSYQAPEPEVVISNG